MLTEFTDILLIKKKTLIKLHGVLSIISVIFIKKWYLFLSVQDLGQTSPSLPIMKESC